MGFRHRHDLIGIFAHHRVAANLLMVLMLLAGLYALGQLNRQFFPNFELEIVQVRTVWQGGSPEDVETAITIPIEQELRTLDGLKEMTSTSATGVSSITLEYHEGTDMGAALDQVEERVGQVRDLPTDAEQTRVIRTFRKEPVARVLVYGPENLGELRPLVRKMERELLARGVSEISIRGLPDEEIAIQVPMQRLQELGMSLEDVGRQLAATSRDLPAGLVGRSDVARQVRTLQQQRDELGFEDLPLTEAGEPRRLTVGDIATVTRRPKDNQVRITHQGKPAVELRALRDEGGDSLESARIIQDWVADTVPGLPPNVSLLVYDEQWSLIRDRIALLLKNGAGGLLLVIGILYIFLNGRVAFWVMAGIPISFMATLGILYAVGGSINMISLFGLIMALTTVAAFMPLLAVGGIIGNILFDIPLVIICVIVASLVECFLVLPGHLQHSFRRSLARGQAVPGRFRQRLDHGFDRFRERVFRPLVGAAVAARWTTLSAALGAMILAVGLLVGGRIGFTFFPGIEGNHINANVSFVAGTPPQRLDRFLAQLEAALLQTEAQLGGGLVAAYTVRHGESTFGGHRASQTGEQFGSILVELIPSDQRDVRNEDFIAAWEARLVRPPGVERLTITSRQGGPPGRDLEIRLANGPTAKLKAASLELQEILAGVDGVSAVEDDMPFGPPQLIFRVSPQGEALGLTTDMVGRQLRAAFDGYLAQIFHEAEEEVEVRVVLPDAERHKLAILEDLTVILPGGDAVPLGSVVELTARQGFDAVRRTGAQRTVNVFADVDRRLNNADRIRDQLRADLLPRLAARYGIEYSFEGKAADQRDTMVDMKRGAVFAVVMIYLVLAWVFASYGWPLVVMAAIPFGIVGAIVGHYLLDIELTILSLFGFFGLAGIVVNDSIILVVFYKQLRERGRAIREAIVEAACQRLRAVLLTSMTTIAGLTPLLFETSLQAQFLIPMAVTISFGLAFATLLVLLVIPALLSIHEDTAERLGRGRIYGPDRYAGA
jgi:multidrug efflux pump subunit AcrB